MSARKFKLPALLILGTLILATGCGGKRVGSLVDPAEQPKESPAPATPTPAPSTPPAVINPSPGVSPNPGNPSNPGQPGAQLTATSEVIKNGNLLGMGEIVIKVSVTNPSTSTLSGEAVVTFTNGGKPTTEVESLRVTVLPGETVTRYAQREGLKHWGLDNATVTVKTDAPVSATNTYGYGYGY